MISRRVWGIDPAALTIDLPASIESLLTETVMAQAQRVRTDPTAHDFLVWARADPADDELWEAAATPASDEHDVAATVRLTACLAGAASPSGRAGPHCPPAALRHHLQVAGLPPGTIDRAIEGDPAGPGLAKAGLLDRSAVRTTDGLWSGRVLLGEVARDLAELLRRLPSEEVLSRSATELSPRLQLDPGALEIAIRAELQSLVEDLSAQHPLLWVVVD